jgi:hypothetical protein
MFVPVIPAKAGISGEGAGKEPHEIPAFAGMAILGNAKALALAVPIT